MVKDIPSGFKSFESDGMQMASIKRKRDVQKKLENYYQYHREKELKLTVSCKFSSWCDKRNTDPYSVSFVDCAEFLRGCFKEGLQYKIDQSFHLL